MAGGRKTRHIHEENVGELNLVPYMDIVVNLILFLMISSTGFVHFGVINVSAPQIGSGEVQEQPEEPPLNLTIGISARGFYIEGTGGNLLTLGAQNDPNTPPSIAKTGDTYDYAALTKKLIDIKTLFHNETKVTIMGDRDILYEVVVKVMDASRQDGNEILFPDVLVSPGFA